VTGLQSGLLKTKISRNDTNRLFAKAESLFLLASYMVKEFRGLKIMQERGKQSIYSMSSIGKETNSGLYFGLVKQIIAPF
jgi:hypothetical protein